MKAVCDALAELIRESGLSIRAIARYANTPESTIRNILRGRTVDPRLSTVADICRACGTSIERLFGAPNTTQSADFSSPKCAEYDAPAPESVEKCVENDAQCAEYDAKNDKNVNTNEDSKNVYSSGQCFPDECGDDILRMCHSIANTGYTFSDLEQKKAQEASADNEVRRAQERLAAAIAAREKLKGDKHGQN